MATVKKYAGLPDLDLGTEVYETAVPDLTEASTLPTGSDSSVSDANSDIDRQELNPENARHFFEPTVVDASNVNFSDTIDGGRRSYQIRTRRRRRRAGDNTHEYDSDESREETLQGRLAHLRKEAIELQADIERAEGNNPVIRDDNLLKVDKDEDGDSVYEDARHQAHPEDLSKGIDDINHTLNDIRLATRKKKTQTLEDEFLSTLSRDNVPPGQQSQAALTQSESLPESSINAIAAFSDRITMLETFLGVSPLSRTTTLTTSILPTLDVLTTQIETLHNTLAPRAEAELNPMVRSSTHLDPLAEKIRQLISESKRLEQSRKAATKSFEEFLEHRDRHANLFHAQSQVVAAGQAISTPLGRQSLSRTASGQLTQQQAQSNDQVIPTNGNDTQQPQPTTQLTSLFLDNQSTKITALHSILPTIQSLEPLLPVVLERLRALSVMHAGAADVKGELDEIERRLARQEEEVDIWRGVVEKVEGEIVKGREVLKGNVEVVRGLVGSLEGRVKELK